MPEAESVFKSEIKKDAMVIENQQIEDETNVSFVIEFNEDGTPIDCHKVKCFLFVFVACAYICSLYASPQSIRFH